MKIPSSAEYSLLLYCARPDISDDITGELEKILKGRLNWPYILRESIKESLPCLLYHNLLPFKDKVPEDIRHNLEEFYYGNAHRNIRIYQGLDTVLRAFNKEGLGAIPLKGAYLAEKAYGNIALRGMTDIDLLVKKDRITKIDEVLKWMGYNALIHKDMLYPAIEKSYLNSVDYIKTGGEAPNLHIHWHIVNVSLPTYMYSKNIRMDRFWQGAKSVKIGGVETLELAPHHLIMYLAEHALKHSFDRLILLSDIYTAIKIYRDRINWDKLAAETIEYGMERQVFYSLYFTGYFLGAEIPENILSKLKPKKINFLEKRFFCSVSNNDRRSGLCYGIYLNMVKGRINKIRFIFRTLFPPPCVVALFRNLNKPKITAKDYLSFLQERFARLKDAK